VALNRMEHRLVDGPVLFELDADARLVGVLAVYATMFLAVFAEILVWISYFDFGLVVAVAFVCEFKVPAGALSAETLGTAWTAVEAMIPLLPRMVAKRLKNPTSVPASFTGIAG
jgi:hypothetical protein